MKKIAVTIFILFISINTIAEPNTGKDTHQKFIDFLDKSLNTTLVDNVTTKEFYQRSWAYWHANKLDYNLHPEKYSKALSLFYDNKDKFKRSNTRNLSRYEDKIENFIRFDNRNRYANKPVLFIGSSSVSGWETGISFPELPIINRGLGGIDVSEIIHYYDVLIKKHAPTILVIYCDIDVEMGKSPDVVIATFKRLVNKVKNDFPDTHILLLSMKPTLIDDFLGKKIRKNKIETNKRLLTYTQNFDKLSFIDITNPMFNQDGRLRSEIFLSDGMHLNETGYALWTPIVRDKVIPLSY